MNPYDDIENEEIEELTEEFKQAADRGIPTYFDQDDYEDIICNLLESGQMSYAELALRQAVGLFPDDAYFRLLFVKYYTLLMNFDAAQKELDYIETHFEVPPELYVEKVVVAHAMNQPVNAVDLLKKALTIDDAIPEVHLLLSYEYLAKEDLDNAVRHAIRAVQLDDTLEADLPVFPFEFQVQFEKYNAIICRFFERLTKELPLSSTLWSALGYAYLNIDQFDKAIEAFQFQLSLDGEVSDPYFNLAEAYFEEGHYRQALNYYELAKEKSDFLQYNDQIGRCYYHLQESDKALRYLLQAQEDAPMLVYVTGDITRIFKEQGKYDEARTYLRLQIQKNPRDVQALEELIELLDPERDEVELHRICTDALDNEEVNKYSFLCFFVYYCCHSGGEDLGIEICSNYLDDPEVCTSVHYFMAALYLEKGYVQQGCEYLELALQADPVLAASDFDPMDANFHNIPEVLELFRLYGETDDLNTIDAPLN